MTSDPISPAAGVGRIDHIGIAVRGIEELLPFYRDGLGLATGAIEEVPGMGVRVLKLAVGGSTIELIEGTDPAGVIAKFVATKGPGIHHVCLEVSDLEAATARLRARGCAPVFDTPRTGAGGHRVNFLKPADAGGVLYELVERASAH